MASHRIQEGGLKPILGDLVWKGPEKTKQEKVIYHPIVSTSSLLSHCLRDMHARLITLIHR